MTPSGRRRAATGRSTLARLTRRGRAVVAAVVVAALLVAGAVYALAGRGSEKEPAAAHGPTAASASASASRTPALPAEASFAQQVFTLWARPRLAYQQWWSALSPHLSAQGSYDLAGTDPARLPRVRVTGDPQVVRRENGIYAQVRVPTDGGSFRLSVTRPTESATWRLDGIDFPEAAR